MTNLAKFLKTVRLSKEGFLQDYMRFSESQESPEDFHLWTALGLLSSALSRNVWIDMGHFKLYPNLWIVLVAESGMMHKSTVLGMGARMLREALPELPFCSQKLSTESLIEILAAQTEKNQKAAITILASEFSVFFGKSVIDQSLIHVLTDIWDCAEYWSYTTVTRGEKLIRNLYVTMLAGTTPEWIKSSLPEDSVGGGFASRMLLIYRTESGKTRRAFPEMSKEAIAARQRCVNDLKSINNMMGEMRMTREAKQYFSNWYSLQDHKDVPASMRGYFSRKGDYILKLSMIFSASFNDSMVIDVEHMAAAVAILEENEIDMEVALAKLAQTDAGKKIQKVYDYIAKSGSILHSQLVRSTRHFCTPEELFSCLTSLLASEEIKKQTNVNGRSLLYYVNEKGKTKEVKE